METAYTRIMGHMDVVSIISDYFNIYFPIALLALCTTTYFSIGSRLLSGIDNRLTSFPYVKTYFHRLYIKQNVLVLLGLGFQQFLTQDSEMFVFIFNNKENSL